MKKILIIDDDKIIINILSFLFEKEGFQTFIASNGIEGINQIMELKPELIITDIMMPFKSGTEIIHFVKENFPSTPIIIVSSLGKEEIKVTEVTKLGANAFFSKPFDPNQILLKVKELI